MDNKTIYALSTVYGKSGVAVIRVSGPDALKVISRLTDIDTLYLKPRYAYFKKLEDKKNKTAIDNALILYFKAPYSFTGEDVVEIQCHGSKAVLASLFKVLSDIENLSYMVLDEEENTYL